MTRDDKRCVITGLGMICAIGNSVEECWAAALSGKSGIDHTKTVDTENCYADMAGEVKCADLDKKGTEHMDRASKLCIRATDEAMKDAGLTGFGGDKRSGVIMGSCVGGVVSMEAYYKHGKKTCDVIAQMPISAIASQVAGVVGAGGPVTNIGNACAAGTISISHAADLIRAGKADIIIAGGSDAFASVPFAGFTSLHALSDKNCSPFNHSTGLNLGEGAGALVVESLAHAKARGAHIYCEVLGAGVSSDANHITAPREDGECQMFAIDRAIQNSGVGYGDIGYINAHGTGTAKNDAAEFLSLHALFDGKNDDLSVSSTKSMTGHCLGAAGAVEAVISVKALTEDIVPPTVGYDKADLEALKEKAGKLDMIPNKPRKKKLSTVMSNSFAFGGNNASIIFSENPGDVKSADGKKDIYITGIGAALPTGNGVDKYIELCNSGTEAAAEIPSRAAVGLDDYNALGLKMAFYRKLDRFSQLQAVSGMQALADGGYTVTAENAFDGGIVVGTSEGAVEQACDFEIQIAEHGNSTGSAFRFPNTVYNAAGGYLSICSGLKGYNVTVTNGAQSAVYGLGYAMQVIDNGDAKAMVVAGTDTNNDIMDELLAGVGVKADATARAYNFKKDTMALSDGSVSILVEEGESMRARGAKPYAKVIGFGTANKPVPFYTVKGSDEALDAAIQNALKDAGVDAREIDAVIGFANGHKEIDTIEAESLKRVFDRHVPTVAIKNRVGEGRAATAALAVAHAALLLSEKIPTDKAYTPLAFKVPESVVFAKRLNKVLVISFGSGGTYSAVVLEKA